MWLQQTTGKRQGEKAEGGSGLGSAEFALRAAKSAGLRRAGKAQRSASRVVGEEPGFLCCSQERRQGWAELAASLM